MPYTILITTAAAGDLVAAVEYYNQKAENLGYLRIFNTWQDPLW